MNEVEAKRKELEADVQKHSITQGKYKVYTTYHYAEALLCGFNLGVELVNKEIVKIIDEFIGELLKNPIVVKWKEAHGVKND